MPDAIPGAPGFTPTCVGKTATHRQAPDVAQVHPHVCGENFGNSMSMDTYNGSPPRVWGKLA